jgi:DNA topoisomerase-2
MTEEFKVLTDREHVLARTNVYLGSTSCEPFSGIINFEYKTKMIVPALIKMVEEVYQNSIDEHIRTKGEFATHIDIDISNTLEGVEITISDNGRGIPQENIGGIPRPVLAWTELRAGSNFDDSNRLGAGTNGMGAALTNIFSKSFVGTTCNGVNKLTVTCSDNMKNISHKNSKGTKAGTSVKFIPDLSRFNLLEFDQHHIDVLYDRILNLAILYQNIKFTFNGEKIHFKNIKAVAKCFHENSVCGEFENFSFVLAPAGDDEEFRLLSYVNGIYIKNGGAHINYVLDQIISTLKEHIRKKYKIDVLSNQIKQHLLFASWMQNFPALRFDSQSKERITNTFSEIAAHLEGIDFDKIAKQILNTPEILDPMIQAILYKKEQAEARELAKKQKSTAKIRVVNHIAATDPNPENRTLHICEGLSAIGNLITVRDSKRHGGYPLRCKILNTRGMKPVDIIKNKEIRELLAIIGLEFGKPATNLNYGKIAIMVDSDVDGAGSIQCLLLNLFSNWPELYKDNRVFRLMTPLYICTKGKDVHNFYSKEEFDKFNSKGYEIVYAKGLGTLTKESYKQCIMDPFLVRISGNAADLDKLEMAFGDSADGRKEWMMTTSML